MTMTGNHIFYLAVSILITIVVGRTLHKHGRIFLIDVFDGNTVVADAVNHLLLVGFYLLNIALVSLAVRLGGLAVGLEGSMEYLSQKIGWVMLILGAVHFFNVTVLCRVREKKLAEPVWITEFGDD